MTYLSKRQPIPFGKYLLLDRVNIGGMAEVWRGKDADPTVRPRLVAIKRILPNIAEDDEFIRMFIDEARICAQLMHPNIAQIFDLGEAGSSYFIAMEYIPGRDLRAVFDRCRKLSEKPSIAFTCYVIAQLCDGMDHAHRLKDARGSDMNIVHRDVSPQNVLIAYEGDVKVIDFGIAKAAGKVSRTQAGILKGKFGYMSPEQIRGVELDRRADIFSIGICLHELLTGERLFVGSSDFSVLEKVRKAQVPAPSTLDAAIPEALEQIVMKALAREPEHRYQHAGELARDLRIFLARHAAFSRSDVAVFMKRIFADELERERQRVEEYLGYKTLAELQAPPLPPSAEGLDEEPVTSGLGESPDRNGALLSEGTDGGLATMLLDRKGAGDARDPEPLTPAVTPVRSSPLENLSTPGRRRTPSRPLLSLEPSTSPSEDSPLAQDGSADVGPDGDADDRPPTVPSRGVRSMGEEEPPRVGLSMPTGRGWRAGFAAALAASTFFGLGIWAQRAFWTAPPPASPSAYLVVDVPAAAQGKVSLTVNGQSLGVPDSEGASSQARRWPVLVPVQGGQAEVTLDGPGFTPVRERVAVSSNAPTLLLAELAPAESRTDLIVVASQEGASIKVDGRLLHAEGAPGRTVTDSVAVGKDVKVEVQKRGHVPFRTSLTPRQDRPNELFVHLKPVEYGVVVRTEPRGATVFLDGRAVGRTPLNLRVPASARELVLRKSCYGEEKLPLELTGESGTTSFQRRLTRRPKC